LCYTFRDIQVYTYAGIQIYKYAFLGSIPSPKC
jgi:hypothetical protein